MYKYQTVNDFRTANQKTFLCEIAKSYLHPNIDCGHNSSFENNVKPYMGLIFGLKSAGKCAVEAEKCNFDFVYLNFTKKFQFPNPGTQKFKDLVEQGVQFAPFRVIVKIVYFLRKRNVDEAYLTCKEINDFVFFNQDVVEGKEANFDLLIDDIIKFRHEGNLPDYVIPEENKTEGWKVNDRGFRDLMTTFSFCNFVMFSKNDEDHSKDRFSFQNYDIYLRQIMDVVGYNRHLLVSAEWGKKDFEKAYLEYFNEDVTVGYEQENIDVDNEQAFRNWMAQQKKDNGEPYASTTIDQECSRLKNAKGKDSIKDIIPCENLFEIDDAESIDNVRKNLENKIAGDESAKNETDGLPNALNLYYQFLVQKHERKTEDASGLDKKTIVEKIANYIKYNGFNYSGNLIENFYLSLKSKPFVILAGISGTGKTRLVKLFAEAIDAGYKLISVRPDWSDSSDLFGHVDLQNHFISGPLTKAIKEANENPDRPYFVCLDEMNLARVEYYLSDFLSNIETRKLKNGKVITEEPIFIIPKHKNEQGADVLADNLFLPNNMYIVGTVNMDETTFPFSKKVLDRANTIEFSEVDLEVDEEPPEEQGVLVNVPTDFLKAEYVILKDCFGKISTDNLKEWIEKLSDINKELEKLDMHVGYRVRDEICFYLLNNKLSGNLLDDDEAFNTEVMQKVLPRIQGSDQGIKKVLVGLFNVCNFGKNESKYISFVDDVDTIITNMNVEGGNSLLSRKIILMLRRLEDNGNTSFWL